MLDNVHIHNLRGTNQIMAIWYICHTDSSQWSRNLGPSLNNGKNWKDCLHNKQQTSVPHDINWAEMRAVPIITEALLLSMTSIRWFWRLLKQKHSRLSLMASKQLAEHVDAHCWCAEHKNGSNYMATKWKRIE